MSKFVMNSSTFWNGGLTVKNVPEITGEIFRANCNTLQGSSKAFDTITLYQRDKLFTKEKLYKKIFVGAFDQNQKTLYKYKKNLTNAKVYTKKWGGTAENKGETEKVDPIVSLLVIIELAESFSMV